MSSFEFLGVEQTFTQLAGEAKEFEWVFTRDGSPVELGEVTLTGVVVAGGGEELPVVLEHVSGETGTVRVKFPRLSEPGTYDYEVRYSTPAGAAGRVVFGRVGVVSSALILEETEALERDKQTLLLKLPEQAGGHIQLEWLAGSVLLSAAEKAQEAVESAEAAEAAKNAALVVLQQAQKFMESFDSALRESIKVVNGYLWIGNQPTDYYLRGEDGETPRYHEGYWFIGETCVGQARGEDGITPHITSDGYWAFGSHKTNVKAAGKDGLDGTAVRRILVDSYEDIPWEGETCNGGYYYYVYNEGETYATGWLRLVHSPDSDIGLYINGVHIYSNTSGDLPYQWADLINAADCGVTAVVDSDNTATIKLTAKVAGEAGNRITLELGEAKYGDGAGIINPSSEIISGATLTGGADEGWEVYAWLEPEGWVCVGLANDIATSEVYGLVKLGTDVPVASGAPVGKNADGQMTVPIAGAAVAGTGKLSYNETLDAQISGKVGKSADDSFCVAAPELYTREDGLVAYTHGSVAPSRTDELARVICLGIIPDGTMVDGYDRGKQLGCTRAQDDTYGVVKAQYVSTADSCNNVLWNIPIGIRNDFVGTDERSTDNWYCGANGMMFIPLAEGGALQWQSSSQLMRNGKTWSTGGELVFRHTEQFEQGELGLTLVPATTTTLAGVYLAASLDDDKAGAVPTAAMVWTHLEANYYKKPELYTKSEVDTMLEEAIAPYATVSWVQDNYETKAEADAKYMHQRGVVSVVLCGVDEIPPAHEQEKGVMYIGL